jgi:hypothetical protein
MKTIYICGDSFASVDADYPGVSWTEQLASMVDARIVNLSFVAASNLLISIQVQRAIQAQADYVICLGTTVTREELKLPNKQQHTDLLDRFWSFQRNNNTDKDLMSYSWLTIENYPVDQNLVREFYTQYFDLDLAIYRNQCIIENTLQKLTDSGIPFMFDQGGFEHKSFGGLAKEYFIKYKNNISSINLWDYAVGKKNLKPYFHFTDPAMHTPIAEYYAEKIKAAI